MKHEGEPILRVIPSVKSLTVRNIYWSVCRRGVPITRKDCMRGNGHNNIVLACF